MKSKGFKIMISFCFLVLLNACGIGHYHHLNLERPDKKTTTALIKSKHKTNKEIEVFISNSAIEAEVNDETSLLKTENTIFKRTYNLENTFLKKPVENTEIAIFNKKYKLLKKYKQVKFLKNRSTFNNESEPKPDHGFNYLLFFVSLFCATILTGLIVLFFNLELGLWLILSPIAIFIALCILFIIFDLLNSNL